MNPIYESGYRPLTTYIMENPNYPAHMQASVELLFMYEGSSAVMLDSACYLMNPGDFMFVAPNQIHSFRTDTLEPPSLMQCLICPLGECGDFISFLSGNVPVQPMISCRDLPSDIAGAMKNALAFQRDNHMLMKAYLQLVLALFISSSKFVPLRKHSYRDQTEAVVSYISMHFTSDITLELLAREFGMNRYNISRIFSNQLKTTLPLYINSLRIDHAIGLLTGTEMRITDIALECGYESLRTFNRQFRNICKMTPREYRQKASFPKPHG